MITRHHVKGEPILMQHLDHAPHAPSRLEWVMLAHAAECTLAYIKNGGDAENATVVLHAARFKFSVQWAGCAGYAVAAITSSVPAVPGEAFSYTRVVRFTDGEGHQRDRAILLHDVVRCIREVIAISTADHDCFEHHIDTKL